MPNRWIHICGACSQGKDTFLSDGSGGFVVCYLVRWIDSCLRVMFRTSFFFFQAEDGIRDYKVTGVQTCALPPTSGAAPRRLRRLPPAACARVSHAKRPAQARRAPAAPAPRPASGPAARPAAGPRRARHQAPVLRRGPGFLSPPSPVRGAAAVAPPPRPCVRAASPGRGEGWPDRQTSAPVPGLRRSEEHTSELQSPCNLVCRLLLEKTQYARPKTAHQKAPSSGPPAQHPCSRPISATRRSDTSCLLTTWALSPRRTPARRPIRTPST